jgi:DNA polymerase alpha subunit A
LSARELVRETNYDLNYLASSQLGIERKDFDLELLPKVYKNANHLIQIIEHTEKDAFLTFELLFVLNIIPLSKQLTNIAGNLWFRSL